MSFLETIYNILLLCVDKKFDFRYKSYNYCRKGIIENDKVKVDFIA